MNIPDPLIAEGLLADVAIAGACVFEDVHMASASKAVRNAVRMSLITIISTAVLAYLSRIAQNGSSQPESEM